MKSSGTPGNVYIADLNEYVSFLGDLHFQLKDVPDGGKVRLIIGKKPEENLTTDNWELIYERSHHRIRCSYSGGTGVQGHVARDPS
jgi:hypothetical protein